MPAKVAIANGKALIFTLRAGGVCWLILGKMLLLSLMLLAQTPAPASTPSQVATPVAASASASPAATTSAPGNASAVASASVGTGSEQDTAEAKGKEVVQKVKGLYDIAKDLYAKFIDYLPHLAGALLVLLVGWWVAGWVKRLLRRVMLARHVDLTLSSFLSNLSYWLIIAVVVLAALTNAQFNTTPFSAVLGASALAVGLAMQNSLSNFAAGVLIVLFRHMRVGDEIETGSIKGVVEEISIFNTNLRTGDNRLIVVPNGSILSGPLINNSAKPERRLDIVFNVSYGSELRKAREIMLEIVKADKRTRPQPAPDVVVSNLGESSVDLTLRVWVGTADYADLKFALLEAVKLRFDEAGIDIPFPQHEVHVRQVS